MLFDIQGKRRRVVQATYLTLALLMGGGLVLFGIGGDVSGGLFDAFSDRGGSGSDLVEERVEKNEKRIERRPRDEEARKELVRDYYSLGFTENGDSRTISEDAKELLRKASVHWASYLEIEDGKPDAGLARVALQLYDPNALNEPQNALRAARILAEQGKDPGSYLQLVQYALLANDERTQKLATQKALDLARNQQERKLVRDQLKQIERTIVTQQIQQGDVKLTPNKGKQGGAEPQGGGGK